MACQIFRPALHTFRGEVLGLGAHGRRGRRDPGHGGVRAALEGGPALRVRDERHHACVFGVVFFSRRGRFTRAEGVLLL